MKVHIIGVGPGAEDYLFPVARSEIEKDDCLIGAERFLALFRDLGKEEVRIQGHLDKVIPYIKKYKDKYMRKKANIIMKRNKNLDFHFIYNIFL